MYFLAVYQPNLSTYWSQIGLGSLLLLICLFGVWFINRPTAGADNRQRSLRMVLAMLAFFGGLLCMGMVVFGLWSVRKLVPVQVEKTYTITPYGKADYTDIQQMLMKESREVHPLTGQPKGKPVFLLMLVETSGKTHVMSEENYPVREIYTALKPHLSE